MKSTKIEPEIVRPVLSPMERVEHYRGVLSTLQINKELAQRRASLAQAQLDREQAEVAVHVERHEGAKRELARLEMEAAK